MTRYTTQELYKIGSAAGQDAANRSMRKAGRTAWDESDYAAAVETFEKVYGCPGFRGDGTSRAISPSGNSIS